MLVLPIFITSTGDINSHPGPIQYPYSMCIIAVRKRVVCCDKCGLWVHKRCYKPSTNVSNDSSYICRPCKDNKNRHSDNVWHQSLFAADKTVPSETQGNPDFGTSRYTDNWKVFNKRGLQLIHLHEHQ